MGFSFTGKGSWSELPERIQSKIRVDPDTGACDRARNQIPERRQYERDRGRRRKARA